MTRNLNERYFNADGTPTIAELKLSQETERRLDALEAAPPGVAAWGGIAGTLSNQSDLQFELDSKQASGSYAAASHTHTKSEITDFSEGDYATVVQGAKADTASQPGHTHTESEITDLGSYQPLASVLTNTTASYTTAEETKLAGIEAGATSDQTGAEIVSAIDTQLGSSGWQSGGGGLSEYMVPIWAEENSGLGNNTFEWAFGNGANTPYQAGISIYVPSGMECHIVAMSAVTNNASGSALIEAQVNNLYLGASDGVQVQMSGRSTVNSSFTDYALSNGDTVNFRTRTAGTNSSPSTVTAWLRYRST